MPQIIIPPDIKRAPAPKSRRRWVFVLDNPKPALAAFPPRMGFQPRIDSPISSLPRVRDVAHLCGNLGSHPPESDSYRSSSRSAVKSRCTCCFGIRYDSKHTVGRASAYAVRSGTNTADLRLREIGPAPEQTAPCKNASSRPTALFR